MPEVVDITTQSALEPYPAIIAHDPTSARVDDAIVADMYRHPRNLEPAEEEIVSILVTYAEECYTLRYDTHTRSVIPAPGVPFHPPRRILAILALYRRFDIVPPELILPNICYDDAFGAVVADYYCILARPRAIMVERKAACRRMLARFEQFRADIIWELLGLDTLPPGGVMRISARIIADIVRYINITLETNISTH